MTTLAMATADLQDLSILNYTSGTVLSATRARTGTYSYRITGNISPIPIIKLIFPASATIYGRVAVYVESITTGVLRIYAADINGIYNWHLELFASGAIAAYRGYLVTLLGQSVTGVIIANAWNVIEFKVFVSNTVGTVDVKVNGVSVLALTNQDTCNAGQLSVTSIYFGNFSSGILAYLDDIVIDDANWPGLGGLYVRPATGNGFHTAWTGDYTAIDENPPSDVDFITTNPTVSGTKDSFTKDALPATTSIVRRIGLVARGRVDGAGGGIIAPFIRSNGIDNIPTGRGIDVSFIPIARYWDTDPGNGNIAWNRTSVDAAEIGVASG